MGYNSNNGICIGISTKWLFIHCFQIELDFWSVDFWGAGGKPQNLEKNPRSKDENSQQTQPACDSGSGNRKRATAVATAVATAFSPLRHPCSPNYEANLACLVNWWGSSKNKFASSDHIFTRLAAALWQDSMSRRGQKSWIFFNFPNWFFVHFWTTWSIKKEK